MIKISVNIKIKAVEEYANGNASKGFVSRKYGIDEYGSQIWVGIYARFGKEPLLNPPKVNGNFRLNLVKWKQENLASISETCIHFGYRSPGAVYQWECLYNKRGRRPFWGYAKEGDLSMVNHHDKSQEEQLRQLQKQNQALQRENLLLKIQLDASKKLTALRKHPNKNSRK